MRNTFAQKFPTSILFDEAENVVTASYELIKYLIKHGYNLVIPPLVDRNEVLLGKTTYTKLLNELTLLLPVIGARNEFSLRADITSQITNLDAKRANDASNRYCYYGSTFLQFTDKPWQDSEQLQLGAEIFGVEDDKAIIEILLLVLNGLKKIKINDLSISLGHSGLLHYLIWLAKADNPEHIYELLLRKDLTSIIEYEGNITSNGIEDFKKIIAMNGSTEQLDIWRKQLSDDVAIDKCFDQLQLISDILIKEDVNFFFDISSSVGHYYHTGISFSIQSGGKTIGSGGCYGLPEITERNACGFSLNAREFSTCIVQNVKNQLVASESNYEIESWRNYVDELITNGYQIIIVDDINNIPKHVTHKLTVKDKGWNLESIK